MKSAFSLRLYPFSYYVSIFYDNVVLVFSPGDEFSPGTLREGTAWLLSNYYWIRLGLI